MVLNFLHFRFFGILCTNGSKGGADVIMKFCDVIVGDLVGTIEIWFWFSGGMEHDHFGIILSKCEVLEPLLRQWQRLSWQSFNF